MMAGLHQHWHAAGRRRARGTRRGFSLVELMVALAVLIFGIYFIFDRFVEARDIGRRDLMIAQARAYAHQTLEELRACDFHELEKHEESALYEPLARDPRFYQKIEIGPMPSKNPSGLIIRVLIGWDPGDAEKQDFFGGPVQVAKGVRYP